jgi:hypothetical protein
MNESADGNDTQQKHEKESSNKSFCNGTMCSPCPFPRQMLRKQKSSAFTMPWFKLLTHMIYCSRGVKVSLVQLPLSQHTFHFHCQKQHFLLRKYHVVHKFAEGFCVLPFVVSSFLYLHLSRYTDDVIFSHKFFKVFIYF